jgi:hypothetical protein
MKARSFIVAAATTAALALAGTASADVMRPGDYFRPADVYSPNDVYRHKPAANSWNGLHAAGTKWDPFFRRPTASAGWTRAQL